MHAHAAVGVHRHRVGKGGKLRRRDDALLPQDSGNIGRIHRVFGDALSRSCHAGSIIHRASGVLQGDKGVVCALLLQLSGGGADGGFIGQGGHVQLCPAAAGNGLAVQRLFLFQLRFRRCL